MSCNCESYTCLPVAPSVIQCGEDIVTSLLAGASSYLMQYEFNGKWFGVTLTTVSGEPIEMPNVFNENYTHKIKFVEASGDLLNDTCYTFDTAMMPTEVTADSPSSSGGLMYTTVTIDEDGAVSFDFALGDPSIIMDGNQSYISGFTWNGSAVTMTNGVTFYDGQTVGIFYTA